MSEDKVGETVDEKFFRREHFGLMTEAELAAVFQVDELTMARWRREGNAPLHIQPGKTVFYKREHVDAWLMQKAAETARAQATKRDASV